MNLLEKLSKGEVALHYNDGDIDGLQRVIKHCFPEDDITPGGDCMFYYRHAHFHNDWDCYDKAPIYPLQDFLDELDSLNKPKHQTMREVERIDKPCESEKPVEFTDVLNGDAGWDRATCDPKESERVLYLGRCAIDGDMFAAYFEGTIDIYKGHLNSVKY